MEDTFPQIQILYFTETISRDFPLILDS